jgi:uncharacterized protein YndB with AHSA1/START domain
MVTSLLLLATLSIDAEVVVDAPVAEVWSAWTTVEGIQSFFAPAANIDLRPGGRYEPLFLLDNPPGKQGCEGCIVLAVQPEKFLSFTWNSPPHLAEVREQFTHVTLRFQALPAGKTKLTFHQEGWGEGGQWEESHAYFTKAWKQTVLPRLQKRFAR